MLIVYNGPHPEVVVDEFNQDQVIVAGEPVEIPDELAARLVEQDTWALVETDAQRATREKQEADAKAAAAKAEADNKAATDKAAADVKAAAEAEAAKAAGNATTKGNS